MMYNNSVSINGLGCGCQSRPHDALTGLGETFNAAQVVGKSLTGKVAIPVKANGLDAAKVLFTVPAGQVVGIVSSYTMPKTGQSVLNWEIKRPDGTYGYVAHATGRFDVKDLVIQGAVSTEDKYKAEQDAKAKEADPIGYYLKKFGLPVLLIGGAIYLVANLGKAVIEKKLK